jgi:hypothetical protein
MLARSTKSWQETESILGQEDVKSQINYLITAVKDEKIIKMMKRYTGIMVGVTTNF